MREQGFRSRALYEEERYPRRNGRIGAMMASISAATARSIATLRAWATKPRSRSQWRGLVLRSIGIAVALLILFLAILWITLPNIDDPRTMFPSQSTVILDRNGVELYRLFSEQDRTYVTGDAINPSIKNATISIEDERFLERSTCFDLTGYMRAALSQVAPRFFVRSGGSTLTQQFAGNALVGRQHSIVRKIRELLLACQLERRYDKNALLELYLNWIPYGHNAYGIEQASKKYFSVSAKDLTLPQSAVLASLPQRPSYFNPYGTHVKTTVSAAVSADIARGKITSISQIPDNAIKIGLIGARIGSGTTTLYIGGRTDQVLKNMLTQKRITDAEYTKALDDLQRLTFTPDRKNIRAPHFVLDVQKTVEDLLGIDESILEQGGFKITTTLDWTIQQAAEKAVEKHRDDAAKRFNAHNIALVALAPKTREVLAYVGNANFDDDEHEGKIDMAKSPRQPGSSFKAFTYLAAFEAGYSPGSVVWDIATKFGDDEPQNFDGTFWGPITIRRALGGSRNIPAVKAFFLGGGEESLLTLARKLGVTTPSEQKLALRKDNPDFDYGWPLAIGAAETPLFEMVQGYASIADGGVYRPVTSILKIADKDDNIRYLPKPTTPQQVVDERLTAMVTSVLSDVNARPNNDYWKSILSIPGFQAAAKTGTSNKCLERNEKKVCTLRRPESNWTMGYTPNLIAGVWAGNATSQSLSEKADGLTVAAPIWHDFMVGAHRKIPNPVAAFTLPPRLAHPLLSTLSGKMASACTPIPLRAADLVLEENVPAEDDPACAMLKVDSVSKLLASPSCPESAAVEAPYFVPKSELPARWPAWEQAVQEWTTKQSEIWNATLDHSGSLLPLPIAPTESCDMSRTPGRLTQPTLTILSPSAGEVVSYPAFAPTISYTVGSSVKSLTFTIDGKPIRTYESVLPATFSLRVPRTVDRAGTHTLEATLRDEYENTVTTSVTFQFDNP